MPAAIQYCALGTPLPTSAQVILLEAGVPVELDDSANRNALAVWNYGPDQVEVFDSLGGSAMVEPKAAGILQSPGGTTVFAKLPG